MKTGKSLHGQRLRQPGSLTLNDVTPIAVLYHISDIYMREGMHRYMRKPAVLPVKERLIIGFVTNLSTTFYSLTGEQTRHL